MRRVLTIALLAAVMLLSPFAAQVSFSATLPPNHAQSVARVIDLVNVERQRAGRQPLVANAALMQASQGYAGVLGDGDWAPTTPAADSVVRAAMTRNAPSLVMTVTARSGRLMGADR